MIREGATLVEDPAEILEELGLRQAADSANSRSPSASCTSVQRSVLEALQGETLSPNELAERTHYELAVVLTALVELELANAVVRGAGSLYRLA